MASGFVYSILSQFIGTGSKMPGSSAIAVPSLGVGVAVICQGILTPIDCWRTHTAGSHMVAKTKKEVKVEEGE